MIVRAQETTEGFTLVIPADVASAWELRENMALEVHRVGSTSEEDTPEAIRAKHDAVMAAYHATRDQYSGVYAELAKGPSGLGPHDPLPYDPRKL